MSLSDDSFPSLITLMHLHWNLYRFKATLLSNFKYTWLKSLRWFVTSGVAGSLIFLAVFGISPLYFSNINWIYNNGGDQLQHFLGWQFYRFASFSLAPASIPGYGYPFGTSLAYTDSIPLAALLLKFIEPLLQQRFQYFGAWTLASFILQFGFAFLILQELTPRRSVHWLGAAFITLAPPMLWRTFLHEALSAHWILLAGLYLLIRARRKVVPVWMWAGLAALSPLVHVYFLPVILGLAAVSLLEVSDPSGKSDGFAARLAGFALRWAPVLLAGAAAGWLAGLFSIASENLAADGYGAYSMNLNALFNPMEYARLLPQLAVVSNSQNEGFNYLGAGGIFLALIGLASLFWNRPARASISRNRYLLGLCLALAVFAVSPKVTLGDRILFEIPLPAGLYRAASVFRSSGRFFWLPFYVLVFFFIRCIARVGSQRMRWLAPFVLLLGLALQWVDLQSLIEQRRFQPVQTYQSPLSTQFWSEAAEGKQPFEHIVLLPAKNLYSAYAPYAIYAAENHMTLNWGYFARGPYEQIDQYGEQVIQELKAGSPDPNSIYVFCNMALMKDLGAETNLAYYRVGDTFLGISAQHPLALQDPLPGMHRLSEQDLATAQLGYYLKETLTGNNVIVLSARGQAFEGFDAGTIQTLRDLGLKVDFDPIVVKNYAAVLGAPAGIIEIVSDEPIQLSIQKGQSWNGVTLPFDLTLVSNNQSDGRVSSIVIDGREFSTNKTGLNLAAYNLETGEITTKAFYRTYPITCP